jgi:hypothetical protein
MFHEADLSPRLGYRPKGEEIDGSFVLHGRTMLLEAKWTRDPHPASSLYQFRGKVDGKLVGTIGLFVSMAGFSEDAINALIAGKELNLILADGDDIRAIASRQISITDTLNRKLRAAAETGIPFLPISGITQTVRRVFIVEGSFDLRVLESVRRILGSKESFTTVPTGGPFNMPLMARALLAEAREGVRFVLIADDEGLPAKSRREITEFVTQEADPGTAEFIFFQPDLDIALGLTPESTSWHDRRRLRQLGPEQLDELIRYTNLPARAKRIPEIATLLRELNIKIE